jgi:hypothetical protein
MVTNGGVMVSQSNHAPFDPSTLRYTQGKQLRTAFCNLRGPRPHLPIFEQSIRHPAPKAVILWNDIDKLRPLQNPA